MTQDYLREVTHGLQQDGKLTKRWFNCQSADLFCWQDNHQFVRFEFCYDKHRDEHALTWQYDTGFTHARVDDGEGPANSKSSPILITKRKIDSDYIYNRFKDVSPKVDFEIRLFVMRKLVGIVVDY